MSEQDYDYVEFTPEDIIRRLELLMAKVPPQEYHDDGGLASLALDVSRLSQQYSELSEVNTAFQRAISALHPQTYTLQHWQTLQAAAAEVAAGIRALGA